MATAGVTSCCDNKPELETRRLQEGKIFSQIYSCESVRRSREVIYGGTSLH
jgi:hypothetical protein